ncbi:hypothetical protein SMITH_87 [Smithella sp. ME-1]|nr:hypothetical protein SMITH_87 [Smithella sp. ME-1]
MLVLSSSNLIEAALIRRSFTKSSVIACKIVLTSRLAEMLVASFKNIFD